MKATTGRSEEEGGGRDQHLRRALGGHLSRGGEPDVSGTPARSQHTGRLQGGHASPSRTPVPGDTRCSAPRSRAEPRARRPRSPWKPSALGGKGTGGRSAQTPPLSRRRWAGGLRGVCPSWPHFPLKNRPSLIATSRKAGGADRNSWLQEWSGSPSRPMDTPQPAGRGDAFGDGPVTHRELLEPRTGPMGKG